MSEKYYVLDPKPFFSDKRNHADSIKKYVLEIEELDPKAVLIFSGSEINVNEIYGSFIKELQPWLISKSRFLYIFSSAPEYDNPLNVLYQNVIWRLLPAYDVVNFTIAENYYKDNIPITTDPVKLFTCYNNSPRNYRTYMIDQLTKFDLLSDGIVTYRWYLEVLGKENNFDPLEDFTYYKGTPRLVDEEDFLINCGPFPRKYNPNTPGKRYLEGLVDVVTESTVLPNEFYLSEKTNKPLMTQKPFLALSSAGYHSWLKHAKGIEPYTEIFDYAFDDLEDYKDRVAGIITNLINLKKEYKTPADYKHLLKMLKPKLEHNLHTYLKNIASGYKLLENFPFDWIMKEATPMVEENLVRGNIDYENEFYMLHCFIQGVIIPYRNNTYMLPDISR